jgi:hypothetical protein
LPPIDAKRRALEISRGYIGPSVAATAPRRPEPSGNSWGGEHDSARIGFGRSRRQ